MSFTANRVLKWKMELQTFLCVANFPTTLKNKFPFFVCSNLRIPLQINSLPYQNRNLMGVRGGNGGFLSRDRLFAARSVSPAINLWTKINPSLIPSPFFAALSGWLRTKWRELAPHMRTIRKVPSIQLLFVRDRDTPCEFLAEGDVPTKNGLEWNGSPSFAVIIIKFSAISRVALKVTRKSEQSVCQGSGSARTFCLIL